MDREVHAATARWLAHARGLRIAEHPAGGLVVSGSTRMGYLAADALRGAVVQELEVSSEDDTASATVSRGLEAHQHGVAERVGAYARALGYDDALREVLTTAAQWHDLGKLDPRFQALLHGGNRWLALAAPEPLAKSSGFPMSRRERKRARSLSGYPHGARHELLSVHLLERAEDLLRGLADPDLCLHIVAAHHGYARPFAPPVTDPEPVTIAASASGRAWRGTTAHGLERAGSGVSARFWRVVRRYGWWGSAWHEALLRLADQRVSAEEQLATAPTHSRDKEVTS